MSNRFFSKNYVDILYANKNQAVKRAARSMTESKYGNISSKSGHNELLVDIPVSKE